MARLIRLKDGASVNVVELGYEYIDHGIDVTSWHDPVREFSYGLREKVIRLKCSSGISPETGKYILYMNEDTWLDFDVRHIEVIADQRWLSLSMTINGEMTWHLPPVKQPRKKKIKITGAGLIRAERKRQINDEGYDANAARGLCGGHALEEVEKVVVPNWPWNLRTFKPPADPVRNLVKAGALIAAEIDRIRAEKK